MRKKSLHKNPREFSLWDKTSFSGAIAWFSFALWAALSFRNVIKIQLNQHLFTIFFININLLHSYQLCIGKFEQDFSAMNPTNPFTVLPISWSWGSKIVKRFVGKKERRTITRVGQNLLSVDFEALKLAKRNLGLKWSSLYLHFKLL